MQTYLFQLKSQASTKYYDARYKNVHKAETLALKNPVGKRGTSIQAVISHINKEMLSLPNNKKLTKSSVHHRAVSQGDFGVSPLKTGRPGKVPAELTRGLACH